jgi:hypothetical protein
MIKPINFLIEQMFEDRVDMLNNFTLASCASQIKYAFAYKDFDINADYNTDTNTKPFRFDFDWFEAKCKNYEKQDTKRLKKDTKETKKEEH